MLASTQGLVKTTEVWYSNDPPDGNGIEVEDSRNAFPLVTYRKNRPKEISVVLKPTTEGTTFWRANPNVVAKEIRAVAQETISSNCINKDGSMGVFLGSEGAAADVMALKAVARIRVVFGFNVGCPLAPSANNA